MDLSAIYSSHPVCERNILARLQRGNVSLSEVNEWSLALDPDTDISDQNHPGGVQSVLALATAARISAASVVIDLGAGIGGSARVLAQAFGCSVLGIERDPDRCRQAIRLTALVGLSNRVTFLVHDALSNAAGIADADVLWGQGAWAHFPSPEQFFDLWLPTLTTSGRVAMSDAFLAREPAGEEESQLARELQTLWCVHLTPIDRWRRALETRGCTLVHVRERTEEARAHFKDTLTVSSIWPIGTVTAEEQHSWVLAGDAIERGLLRMYQLVAIKHA